MYRSILGVVLVGGCLAIYVSRNVAVAVPPVDKQAPAKTETATFALG